MKLWEAGETTYTRPPKVSAKPISIPTTTKARNIGGKRNKRNKKRSASEDSNTSSTASSLKSSSISNSLSRSSALGSGSQSNHWGRATDVYGDHDYAVALDKNDPNYDSTEEEYNPRYMGATTQQQQEQTEYNEYDEEYEKYMQGEYGNGSNNSPPRNNYKTSRSTSNTSNNNSLSSTTSSLSLPDYKINVKQFLSEYFISGDRLEVEKCMRETWMPDFHFEMVKRTITMAMDRNARGCEAASLLLSFLHGRNILTTNEVGKGIERLLEVIDDYSIDVPNASRILSQFVARLVVDELLPPVFLTDPTVVSLGGTIINDSVTLLSVKHGQARVEKGKRNDSI